jgi:hypothetical protein
MTQNTDVELEEVELRPWSDNQEMVVSNTEFELESSSHRQRLVKSRAADRSYGEDD